MISCHLTKDLEDMLTYLTYEANKPEKEQKLTFNIQSKAKSPEKPNAAEKEYHITGCDVGLRLCDQARTAYSDDYIWMAGIDLADDCQQRYHDWVLKPYY
ncbi:hypothetical protein E4U56_000503 [Claviceps arundinis]|uniref:Uncharacterized protein n=1 Tax=Claviceps arundinis TaxID=1623583 RepID=A0A9P7SUF8_9HYPO|nr:hypothetical protein E4U56_000503 [Claviceps arundinis]